MGTYYHIKLKPEIYKKVRQVAGIEYGEELSTPYQIYLLAKTVERLQKQRGRR